MGEGSQDRLWNRVFSFLDRLQDRIDTIELQIKSFHEDDRERSKQYADKHSELLMMVNSLKAEIKMLSLKIALIAGAFFIALEELIRFLWKKFG